MAFNTNGAGAGANTSPPTGLNHIKISMRAANSSISLSHNPRQKVEFYIAKFVGYSSVTSFSSKNFLLNNRSGNAPPPKPWERVGTASSGPTPFKPPSAGRTTDVVEASGTAKPGEIVSTADRSAVNTNTLTRPVPARPWEQNYGSSYGGSYGGYGSGMNYNSGYGNNSSYGSGMYGGSNGGGLYGNSMYRGGMYGGAYGNNSMYGGGGMYGGLGGLGGPMGGYGMGMGGPYGNQDPNNPFGPPPSPPGFWMSFLRVMQGVVNFFGRISILIDQNTQAFHMFMSALLQLFDRSGVLYGELARFVMRVLGIRTKPRKQHQMGPPGQLPGPDGLQYIEGPKAAGNGEWNSVWGDEGSKGM